jgi:hypothetical protein
MIKLLGKPEMEDCGEALFFRDFGINAADDDNGG